jgi:hypothetical protein
VTFVVPDHFDRRKPFDIVVYFHGWETEIATQYRTGDHDNDGIIWYGLDDQVGSSTRNVILIAPQLPKKASCGRPASSGSPALPRGFLRRRAMWSSVSLAVTLPSPADSILRQ